MKLGSLFDGSGGFPLAGLINGIEPVWASEIEPFPIRVTTKRLPLMQHLGDISKLNGAEIPPVDIIAFGSPCVGLSVAGQRAGLHDGGRSSLFFEAIRIIKEMRKATNGKYPRYIVWENVPGAFSSNKGNDFHTVLAEICSVCDSAVSIPKPKNNKWLVAGEIVGDGYSVAWRTLDAQYWGVPQRRRRIYLVADFGGECAGEILFNEGLRGDIESSNAQRKGVAADVVGSVDRGAGVGVEREVIALQANGIDRADTAGCNGCGWRFGKSYTLNTVDRHAVCFDRATFNQGINAQYDFQISDSGVVSTVVANGPSGVCYDARGNGDGKTVCTITGDHQNRITDYTAIVVQETLCFNEGQITSPANGNNPQWNEPCHTLSATDSKAPTVIIKRLPRKYIVRRLTPTECARLQGFPDWWCSNLSTDNPTEEDIAFWTEVWETHRKIMGKSKKPKTRKQIVKWLQNPHSDTAEYKMWGNGVALPCVCFVLAGIVLSAKNTAD